MLNVEKANDIQEEATETELQSPVDEHKMDGLWDNFQLLQASIPMLQPPSPCCNTTQSKEAIAAAAEMRSPDGPSRSPSTTTFVCYPPHCHFFLELTSISYSTYEEWNSYFYVLSNATASTTNTPFCLLLSSSFFLVPQGHSTYY